MGKKEKFEHWHWRQLHTLQVKTWEHPTHISVS